MSQLAMIQCHTNHLVTTQIACLTTQSSNQGDLHKVLSSSSSKKPAKKVTFPPPTPQHDDIIVVNGKRYRSINVLQIQYKVSNVMTSTTASLVDRGANGGLAGSDVRVICKSNPPRMVDVSGIDSHEVRDLTIISGSCTVTTWIGHCNYASICIVRRRKNHSFMWTT